MGQSNQKQADKPRVDNVEPKTDDIASIFKPIEGAAVADLKKNEVIPIGKPVAHRFVGVVGDKCSFVTRNGYNTLSTILEVRTSPSGAKIYAVAPDGYVPEQLNWVHDTDPKLTVASWATTYNQDRVVRDMQRRLDAKTQKVKCMCDPEFECICSVMTNSDRIVNAPTEAPLVPLKTLVPVKPLRIIDDARVQKSPKEKTPKEKIPEEKTVVPKVDDPESPMPELEPIISETAPGPLGGLDYSRLPDIHNVD
jgi:hypothetical protein